MNTIKITGVFVILCLMLSCVHSEPPFTLIGEQELIKDVKINIEMVNGEDITMATAFYQGKHYEIDNQKALYYRIYISYRDVLFYRLETDNLHGKMSGKPANELIFVKQGAVLKVQYRPIKGGSVGASFILQPSHLFFAGIVRPDKEKVKFTAYYPNQ